MSLFKMGDLIKKALYRAQGVSSSTVSVSGSSVTISGSSCSDISIVNGKVFIDGVEQTKNSARQETVGKGPSVSESRAAKEFSAISAGSVFKTTWTPGPPSIELRAPSALLALISTEISASGELSIRALAPFSASNCSIEVICSSLSLKKLALSGSAQADIKGLICDSLQSSLSGSSQASISGSAQSGSFETSGSSQLNAKELPCSSLSLRCSGSSEAEVFCALSLDLKTNGSSSVALSASGVCKTTAELSGASELTLEQGALNGSFKLSGSSTASLHLEGPCSFSAQGSSALDYTGEPQILSSTISGSASARARSKKSPRV